MDTKIKDSSEQQEQTGEVQFLFVGAKAGIDNTDSHRIAKIVTEVSQSSDFYKRQQSKRLSYDERIKEMLQIIEKTKKDMKVLRSITQEVEEKFNQMKQQLILDRTWVHFDMDMFFVACEIRDRPELKDLPVATGGLSMISTANYVARKFGVRSAMPGFIAKKLCPQLILIKSNFDKYRKASDQFKNVLIEYDPDLESMGLDEANLDLTDYLNTHQINTEAQILELCDKIRQQVFEATGGLTCSCGIGPNKMLAKICSDLNKPNGSYQLSSAKDKIEDFMKTLPIRKIPGIGNVTEQLLNGIGIKTCGEIIERMVDIRLSFSETSFDSLISSAIGVSRSWHVEDEDKKSISVSRTFSPISSLDEIHEKIKILSKLLSEHAIEQGKVGKHLAVSFKTHKFITKSRNKMIGKYVQDELSIEKYARELVKDLLPTEPLRLIGIRLSNLENQDSLKQKGLSKYLLPIQKQENDDNIDGNEVESDESYSESILKDSSKKIQYVLNENILSENEEIFESFIINQQEGLKQLSQIIEVETEDKSQEYNKPIQSINIRSDSNPNDYLSILDQQVETILNDNPNIRIEKEQLNQDKEKEQSIKSKFLNRFFECPVCYQQIDSFGNVSFVNNHISACLDSEKTQFNATNQQNINEPAHSNSKQKMIRTQFSSQKKQINKQKPIQTLFTYFNKQN